MIVGTASRTIAILLFLASFLTGPSAVAAVYNVTPSGNDNDAGTKSAPWRTLSKAATVAQAGDVVTVAKGEYAGFAAINSGTKNKPITFQASGDAVINQPAPNSQDNIVIKGVDYIVVKGFAVEDAPAVGIRIESARGVVVDGNSIRRSRLHGVFASATPELVVQKNVIMGSMEQSGVYVASAGGETKNVSVRRNEIYGNKAVGVELSGCSSKRKGSLSNLAVEGNHIHDNLGGGMGVASVSGSKFQNNIIVNNGVVGGVAGLRVTHDSNCNRPSEKNTIANNTVIESRFVSVDLSSGASQNYVFNNIFVATGGHKPLAVGSGNHVDDKSNIVQTSLVGVFVDPHNGDYRLTAGSRAIGKATSSFRNQNAPRTDFAGTPRPGGGGTHAGALDVAIDVTQSMADEFFVSTTGSDSNDGQTQPWRTLQHAANTVPLGGTVLVEDGTYTGFNTSRGATNEADRITFRANGSNVILNSPGNGSGDIINLEASPGYITIDGFIVQNATRIGIRAVGSVNKDPIPGVIIQNNTVRDNFRFGIHSAFAIQIQVLNNTVYNTFHGHGIYLAQGHGDSNNPDAPVLRGNTSYNNGLGNSAAGNGIEINGDPNEGLSGIVYNPTVEDNICYGNRNAGIKLIVCKNGRVQNNLLFNNGQAGGPGAMHIVHETDPEFFIYSTGNVICNNTLVEPNFSAILFTAQNTGNYVFNNFIMGVNAGRIVEDEDGGNFIDSDIGGGGSNILTNAQVANLNTYFQNPAGDDYHLNSSSPAINAGVATYQSQQAAGDDLEGLTRTNHDVGAYEFGGGGGTPDTTPPSVTITNPADNDLVSGTITLAANASDNIGVAGVQFFVAGANAGSEDTQSPYSTTYNTLALGNGTHPVSAVARDAGGNTDTAPTVNINVSNSAPPAGSHPRMISPARIAKLRSFVAAGTPQWAAFLNKAQTNPRDAWNDALIYLMTNDVSWANSAISKAQGKVDAGIAGISSADRNFLYVQDFIRNVALTYDFCYDRLTAAQKTQWVSYMHQTMYVLWNHDNNPIHTWPGWSVNDPHSSFHSNFLNATGFAAAATDGDVQFPYTLPWGGTNYTDPLGYLSARMNDHMLPSMDALDGGQWAGEMYGEQIARNMYEMFWFQRESGLGATDYFYTTDYVRKNLHFTLYSIQPGHRVLVPDGDGGREPTHATSDYTLNQMLFIADGLEGTPEGAYAQYWVNNFRGGKPAWHENFAYDFLINDTGRTQTDFRNVLPLYFTANATGRAHSRSSWDNDATALTFSSRDRIEGHGHPDQNGFYIYKGSPSTSGTSGWQLCDTQPFVTRGLPKDTPSHNTITVNGESQRFEAGTGDLIKFRGDTDHAYFVGDASDAYWTNGHPWHHGDEKLTDLYIREVVHVLPDHIVIFDRISPTAQFPSASIESRFHYPGNPPVINGNQVRGGQDAGRVFQTILLPENVGISSGADSWPDGFSTQVYYVTLQPQTVEQNYYFLNAFFVTDPSTASPPPTTVSYGLSQNMVGVQIEDPSERVVVMFSFDPNGLGPAEAATIEVGAIGNNKLYLFGLQPDFGYSVDVAFAGGRRALTVAPGSGYKSTEEGSLVIELNDNGITQSEEVARNYTIR